MTSRKIIWAAIAAGALSIVLLAPATSGAAKKRTIGSDLKGTPSQSSGYSCGVSGDPCAIQQVSLPGDPHATRVPFKGTIRKWRFRTTDEDSEGYGLRLGVVRKVGSGASGDGEPVETRFRFVRHSGEKQVGPEPGTYKFKARLKVKRGDFIALELPYGADNPIVQAFYVPHAGALDYSWFPIPPQGSADNPFEANAGTEYFYNATVKKKKKRR
jgi:hypothetical protein